MRGMIPLQQAFAFQDRECLMRKGERSSNAAMKFDLEEENRYGKNDCYLGDRFRVKSFRLKTTSDNMFAP